MSNVRKRAQHTKRERENEMLKSLRNLCIMHTLAHAVLSCCKQAWSNLQRCCFNARNLYAPTRRSAQMQTNNNANINCYRVCASPICLFEMKKIYSNGIYKPKRNERNKQIAPNQFAVLSHCCPCPAIHVIYRSQFVYDFSYTWQINHFAVTSAVYSFKKFVLKLFFDGALHNTPKIVECNLIDELHHFFFFSHYLCVWLGGIWMQWLTACLPPEPSQSAPKSHKCWHFDDTSDEWTCW